MTAAAGRATRALAALFALLTAVQLTALLGDATTVVHLTKPALMPVLAGWALVRGGPWPLPAALLCGCGGDVLLQIGGETAFLAGMGCFAAGHLCYLALFARAGRGRAAARAEPRTAAWVAAGYGAAWLGTVALLWPGLAAHLRLPVAGYSLLLTAMALAALGAGPWTGLGGALFMLSDTLIAAGLADWPRPPVPQFWIMATYVAAQWLLMTGATRDAAPNPGPERALVGP
ncbi:lysoplasmalogenase [Streptomyces malaysiensis subsp. malaysiensis]|uniref:lysoplasmalogenase n=1 Tax=Streptomyces malaysiensis TaxID=92644 RepID=UPI0024BF5A31|nr:lysoplasmalogenase [Streptomyces sp. NA07423]WHX21754.1 lysoplasmalogenase [Streptomyces sp. NA07423]